MSGDVKQTRAYDASGRRQDARQRARQSLDAALHAMESSGYAGMTMPGIARSAGVSTEFLYKTFGDKAGLVRHMLDVVIAGDDEPVPMAQRPAVQAMVAEPDAGKVLEAYAALAETVNGRAGALLLAIAAAAPGEPRLAEVGTISDAQRLAGVTAVVRDIAGKSELTVELDEARDVVWTLTSPDVHDLLVRQRNWSADRYRAFVSKALRDALLNRDSDPPRGSRAAIRDVRPSG